MRTTSREGLRSIRYGFEQLWKAYCNVKYICGHVVIRFGNRKRFSASLSWFR
jgi:hypothetical protein